MTNIASLKNLKRACLGLTLAALTAAGMSGCANTPGSFDPKAQIPIPPESTADLRRPRPKTGSLFTEARADMYADLRARQVGDIIVVEVTENSKAKKKNDTKAERTTNFSAGIPSLFGNQVSTNPTAVVQADFANKTDAKAELTKEDTMTSSIGCTVVEVLNSGNLVVRGNREVQVNGETQYIVLQGTVRPSDVTATNTVQSNQLADAKIHYTGRGVLSDKQQPGWLGRLLDNVWPF
jgi:flagellar L-ring protein precursor FlgH